MAADTCGARRGVLVCDRAPHADGDHRGYDEEHDAVLFWPSAAKLVEELERAIRIAIAVAPDQQFAALAARRLQTAIEDAYGKRLA